MPGREKGTRLMSPAEIERLEKDSYSKGKIEGRKSIEDEHHRLIEQLNMARSQENQQTTALNILRDSVLTLQAITLQAIDLLKRED
jgi:hypothetical protein